MTTILYITEESPFPPYGGGRIRRCGILKALSLSGYSVHAIVGNRYGVNLDFQKIGDVSFYDFDLTPRKWLPVPRYFRIFNRNRRLMRLVGETMKAHSIDIVFLDCYFIGQYISFFKRRGIPVIFGTENAQSQLNRSRRAENIFKWIEIYINYCLQYIHERIYFNKADAVVVVSGNDLRYHGEFVDKGKLYIIPNFLDLSRYTPTDKKGKDTYIIMTGSFNSFQNQHGLTWFLEEVWDGALASKVKLIVAGYFSRELLERIKSKSGSFENVEAVGEVEDINRYISRARAAIVPLFQGSGSRVKILEAMALKTPVISTSRGVEGIDHEGSVIIADSPGDFKKEILKITEGSSETYYETLTGKALDVVVRTYSLAVNRERIENMVKDLLEGGPSNG
jgi:glycosyltransferase involved in cell wall biosynthesis